MSGGFSRTARADGVVVRLDAGPARKGERAGQAHLRLQEMSDAARIGFVGDDGEARGAEEILRHRAPQIPQRLDRGVLLALDERLRVEAEQFAELAQEFRGAVQPDRRLQIGALQRFAQHATELAIHADVDVGVDELRDVREVTAERKHHVDLGADALDQPANLGEIGRHVEGAVDRPDDIDPRLGVRRARLALRNLLRRRIPSTARPWRDRRSATDPRRWCAAGSA